MKTKTLLIGAVVVAGLVGLGVWAFRPQPVPVDLAELQRGPMQMTVDADGNTRIRDIYEVAAPITGQAQRSPVEVGDVVVGGETVVAVVEPIAPELLDTRSRLQAEAALAEAQAALEVANARLRQAEEDLTYAQSQYDRIAKLVDRGVVSLTQLEDAAQLLAIKEAALDAARSSQSMAIGAVTRAEALLIEPDPENQSGVAGACCVSLHAPADGVVLEIDVISARPVTAGTRLLTIGQPDNLEIVADLLSADAVRLQPGARAIVERWGGQHALEARLRRVEPSAYTKVSALGIEEQRVDAVFDLVSPEADRIGLGNGFSVYLRIIEWEADDVLQVPLSALFRDGDGWAVFVERDGLAAQVSVEVGRRNGRVAEVTAGLDPGARVITHPSDRVAVGAAIVDRATLD